MKRILLLGALSLLNYSIQTALAEPQRFTTANLFDGAGLMTEPRKETFPARDGKPEWTFAGKYRGNVTFFSGGWDKVQTTTDGALKFALGEEGALLGWGNFEGKQLHAERVHLWEGPMTVSVTLRAASDVDVTFLSWCDGRAGGKVPEGKTTRQANRKRAKPEGVSAKLKGGAEWQTLVFKTDSIKRPDGIELEFAGAEGASIEVKSVQFSREMHEGFWRKEFTLPVGKIWRAVGDAGMMCSLFVNGREVPSANGMLVRPSLNFIGGEMFGCESLDFAPQLRAGPNAVALHVARNGAAPYVYFTLTVVMESGEVVRMASDGSWKYASGEPLAAGVKVSAPGFDDGAWKPAQGRPGTALSYKQETARPAYAGLILLSSPDEPYLFFRDSAPVEMRVRMPPGIASPQLAWEVQRYESGKFAPVKSGEANGTSPLADVGQLPRGVYTFAAKLTSGGKLLEDRIPEPFVVVGKVPMREVTGDTLTDGLDLALEAEIDYTKPDGPIPWQEVGGKRGSNVLVTKPTITERNGLRFRETGPDQGALISHRYEFKHPGDFYLMELEFPDDVQRWFGVSCTSANAPHTSKDGPATWTGQKYPLTGKMKNMQWIYRPDPGATAINLSNLQRDAAGAAASRLKILHIKNGLPALKIRTQASLPVFLSLFVDVQHAQGWKASGLPVRDYLRQFSWLPEVFQNQPGLWLPKWTHATQRYASLVPIQRNETWPAEWEMSVSEEYNRAFNQPANRAAYVMTHWQEHETSAETLEPRDGWPRPFQMTYQVLPSGDNARELFTQNLITTDPEILMWGFSNLVMQTGHEQPLREFARVLRALPRTKFEPALSTSLQTNLVLREARDGGKLWFIAANPGYWPLRAEVYVANGASVRDAVNSKLVAENKTGGLSIVAIDLKPYEVRAFVADATNAKLAGWKSEVVADADLAHLRGLIGEAEAITTDRVRAAKLLPEEREFITKQAAEAKAALAAQQIAKARSLVTDWRFFTDIRTRVVPMRAATLK